MSGTTQPIVLARADQLDLAQYRRIAVDREPVALAPGALAAVAAARGRLLAHLRTGVSAYGVTTGLGYLASTRLEPDAQRAFQRALLVRGAGTGPPLAPEVVRGAMLLRLTGFLGGAAAVSPRAVRVPRRAAQRRLHAARPRPRHLERRRGDRAQPPLPDPDR